MARLAETDSKRRVGRWRIAGWTIAAVLLLIPLLAMQITDEVGWTPSDFVIAAILIGSAGGAYELAVRKTRNLAYRAAAAIALAAAFLLIWMNLAVGIIGAGGDPANLIYGGVLAAGIVGAVAARFEPSGMVRALAATAAAQMLAAAIALIAGLGPSGPLWPLGFLLLNGVFAALWLLSALLFRRAAHTPEQVDAAR